MLTMLVWTWVFTRTIVLFPSHRMLKTILSSCFNIDTCIVRVKTEQVKKIFLKLYFDGVGDRKPCTLPVFFFWSITLLRVYRNRSLKSCEHLQSIIHSLFVNQKVMHRHNVFGEMFKHVFFSFIYKPIMATDLGPCIEHRARRRHKTERTDLDFTVIRL